MPWGAALLVLVGPSLLRVSANTRHKSKPRPKPIAGPRRVEVKAEKRLGGMSCISLTRAMETLREGTARTTNRNGVQVVLNQAAFLLLLLLDSGDLNDIQTGL